jgi:large subunit ribosomal protein L16
MFNPTPRHFRKPNRKAIRNTYENKSNRLRFGTFGIQAIEKGFLTAYQIEAIRRTITGRLKRKGKVWIRAFPDYPRTAKPKEVRMGRGKGGVDHWVCVIKPGRVLFEAASRDAMLVRDALSFALRKLPMFAQIIERTTKL